MLVVRLLPAPIRKSDAVLVPVEKLYEIFAVLIFDGFSQEAATSF